MRKRFSGSSAFQSKKAYNDKPKAMTTGAQARTLMAPLPMLFWIFAPKTTVDDRAEQRQEHDPANEVSLYRMVHLISQPLNF